LQTFDELRSLIREQEVGRGVAVATPYGRRILCYADLTATGRFLQFIEAWLTELRPFYANTHTAVSTTGRIMSRLREEAREVVGRSVHASPQDVVLFVGSGATAAINKLVGLLGFRISEPLERAHHLRAHIPEEERPVVFVGPYEHHSNELPWVESIADVVEIELDAEGAISLSDLASKLAAYGDRRRKVGAFSAASNVTGVLTDVRAVARILHEASALATFDYAASGPYVPIDMHPSDPRERIDALSISTHKFMGGPNSSGVLVAHRDLFVTRTPERPGGGTVAYVGGPVHTEIDYTTRLDEREEGGTPSIIGDLRAGVAFLLKDMLGPERILAHEKDLAARAIARLSKHPRIRIYGPLAAPRLAILPFNVDGLHHDFVSTLLDHLFGIQNRAGCSCAGPYGHRLLGVDREASQRYRELLGRGVLAIKPGWVRVSIPYYASDDEVDFILSAIEFVAERGDAFLADYRLSWRDGIWRHASRPVEDVLPIELGAEALARAAARFTGRQADVAAPSLDLAAARRRYLAEAERLADQLEACRGGTEQAPRGSSGDPEIDAVVWFRYLHCDRLQDDERH
jgi:selenocysteine lyase/cysteine desulfurase